jgi:hypothetical protein
MALIDHLPADVLRAANPTPLVFPKKSVGHGSRPAQPEPQNIPRQTISNWLRSLSRLKKLAGFSPSQTPARYRTGYKARRSPNATIAKRVPADLIAVANPATPCFSREIRRSCFLANATRAQKPSKTTHKLSAVGAVAGPRTFRYRAEPIQPSLKPALRGSPTACEARRNRCRSSPVRALKSRLNRQGGWPHGVRTDHRPRIQSLASCPEHASQQAPSETTRVFRREQARLIKQHPFCKSGFSEVGHLASMVR